MKDSIKRKQNKSVCSAERKNFRLKGKRLLLLAVFSLMVGICSAYDFSAVSPSGHTLYYNIAGSNVKVVSELAPALGSDVYETLPTGDLVIPESVTHDGVTYTVTTIGNCAFLNCYGLTNMTIPATVTTIESGALAGCSGIKNLVVPATVTTIEDNAFRYIRHVEYHGPAPDIYYYWNALSLNGVVDGNFAYPDESKTQLDACLDADANGTVTIPASVQVISRYAFVDLHNLTSIDIPNTVDSIGVGAFEYCENLVSATLPKGLRTINAYLFTGCKSLKSIVVPDSVKSILILAFANCSALSEVTFGYSTEKIVAMSFQNCTNLKKINSLAPVAPVLLNGDPFGKVVKDQVVVTVPGGCMESYKENWTGFNNFKEVWNPNYNVFTYTHEGETLYYRLRTDTLTYQTHALCGYPVFFPKTIENVWDGYEKPVGAVKIASTVEYNGKSYPVLEVGRCTFAYCDEITSVSVPEGVVSMGQAAFYECPRLQSVELPQTIKEIDTHLFQGDSALVSVNIPKSITRIPYRMFFNCVSLQSVTIPDGLTAIDNQAFCYCASLPSITIPEGVTSIGEWAFYDCKALSNITFACTTPPTAGEDTFNSFDATICVPEGTTDLYRQHEIWGKFANIVEGIPGSFAYDAQIDGIYYKFSGDEATVTYQQHQQAYQDETLIEKYISDYTGDIVIPETVEHDGVTYRVTAIGDHAFRGCSGVTSITIPKSVTSIGGYALRQTSLTSITIPESVKSIGECAFYGCESLSSVNIPEGVTTLSKALFYNCYSLPSVVVPESVDSIGPWAFYECRNLTSVNIPKGVEYLDYATFFGCSSLPSITIPEGVKSIGEVAFRECTNLTSIVIPKGVTSIGEAAFSGCTNLASVVLPESLVNIDDFTFNYCESLTSVIIPEGVTRIGNCAFQVCTSMTSITLPESLTTINERTFLGCKNLSDIILPKNLTTIEWAAFSDCVSLKAITIPKSVTQLGFMVFEACSGLESIIVEEGNKVYDSRGNCNAIIETATNTLLRGCQNTIIPKDVTTINYGAFFKCYPLTSIVIPEGVTSMYDGAFQESGLISVTIPSTMKYIDFCVFQDCTNLTEVYCYAEEIPETKETTFKDVPLAAATLYVPESALDKYKTTAPWSQFGNIVSLETPIKDILNDEPSVSRLRYYNLQGHCSGQPDQRGVYIYNGKKIIVK